MKKQTGMRPQDIAILLKIILSPEKWYAKDIAQTLDISQSEVSESLNRSVYSGLLAADKRTVMKRALIDFLCYGLKYVFPQRPGAIVRGMPTAHSAEPMRSYINSEENYVWPVATGQMRGQSIEPLYPGAVEASMKDSKLYELLVLIDVMRVGKTREQNIAIRELEKRIIKHEK